MLTTTKKLYYTLGVSMTVGMMGMTPEAFAQSPPGGGQPSGNNFSSIAENITGSISSLPALLSALSYLIGLLLGVLGIMKIKDHVENPSNTPLKEGAIRVAAGGALFALPIVFEAMQNTIGEGEAVEGPKLNRLQFQTLD